MKLAMPEEKKVYPKYAYVPRKALYPKPIYLSKRQLSAIGKGKMLKVRRNAEHYLEIGLKGYKDPAIVAKIEELKAEIKRLKGKSK